MATYVNDLRLKEIGTGESSGTWGTETNTNLELIGESLGYGTEGITTNADTHTSTVADGSTDPARSMYIKYTGTLDSACTITIAPNTVNRMHFIENATSGSQNIIISQGSGANVTIPNGDVKAVYLDGAGSGAAVVDAFASLNVVDLKVEDDLTVTDDVSIGGALTLTGNGDFNGDLDVDGTTNLDVVDIDGAVDMASTLAVAGTTTMSNASNATQLILQSTDADANSGPVLELFRNSGSPADNDATGRIYFYGENDNDEKIAYSELFSQIIDASDGTEDGALTVYTMKAGTSTETLSMVSGNVGIGVTAHATASLNITNTSQHIRLNNGSELAAISLDTDGILDLWAHGDGESISFRTGTGTGTVTMSVVGGDMGFGITAPTFATGNGFHFADSKYLGLGTGNGTRPDFSLSGNNSGLAIACGTGSDDADILISTAGVMAVPSGIELGSGTDFTSANTLDDYEVGTFTPTLLSSGGSTPNYTASNASGDYVKVGDVVIANFLIIITGVTDNGGSGNKLVDGFPFDQNQNAYQQIGLIGYNDVWPDAVTRFYMAGGNAQIMPTGVTQSNYTGVITTGYFAGQVSYTTNS